MFFVDRDLGDAFEVDFDGVFDGDDVSLGEVDAAEEGVEACGFAGACGAADEDHAGVLMDYFGDLFGHPLGETEIAEAGGGAAGIQDSHD